jgi:molybdenum cofactor biosynthesis enzyme
MNTITAVVMTQYPHGDRISCQAICAAMSEKQTMTIIMINYNINVAN